MDSTRPADDDARAEGTAVTGELHHLGFEYVDEHVLVVTIETPDALDIVDEELHHDLTALFPRLQAKRRARVGVLTGSGREG